MSHQIVGLTGDIVRKPGKDVWKTRIPWARLFAREAGGMQSFLRVDAAAPLVLGHPLQMEPGASSWKLWGRTRSLVDVTLVKYC